MAIQKTSELDCGKQKLPGMYLLLIHPEAGVRCWAHDTIQKQGKISGIDEWSLVVPVMQKFMNILEFDAFQSGDISINITKVRKEFWAGLTNFICAIEHDTFTNYFVKHFPDFITIVQNHLTESGDVFWSVLCIFEYLLTAFGNIPNTRIILDLNFIFVDFKLWVNSNFSPNDICTILMKQSQKTPEERIHKAIFGILPKVLHSLEQYDFESNIRDAVLNFWIQKVQSSDNYRSLAKHLALCAAFQLITRG